MREVKCACCGRTFETTAKNIKYCSPECVVEGKRIMRKRWESRKPDYNHNYYQAHRSAKQEAAADK